MFIQSFYLLEPPQSRHELLCPDLLRVMVLLLHICCNTESGGPKMGIPLTHHIFNHLMTPDWEVTHYCTDPRYSNPDHEKSGGNKIAISLNFVLNWEPITVRNVHMVTTLHTIEKVNFQKDSWWSHLWQLLTQKGAWKVCRFMFYFQKIWNPISICGCKSHLHCSVIWTLTLTPLYNDQVTMPRKLAVQLSTCHVSLALRLLRPPKSFRSF